MRCLNSAPPWQYFAPAPLAELPPHAAHEIIVQVRKPNNAGNQKKEKCDLGLHRAVLFNASQGVRTTVQKAFQS